MANTAYISAGLSVPKTSGQSAASGVNTAFVSAGLAAEPITSIPLTLADDSFSNTEPFDDDEEIGTVAATGGTAPYSYEIISQTLV